jgi:hypothetical protein
MRVNIFGFFVLEPYLAYLINRNDVSKPVFGLGFTPGWVKNRPNNRIEAALTCRFFILKQPMV